MVEGLPADLPWAWIVAQHLSPSHDSLLTELLGRGDVRVRCVEAVDGAAPRAGTVYVTPPNRDVALEDGRLRLSAPVPGPGPSPSVDALLFSLAEGFGERAVGVILSGTGSDGAHGLRAVAAHGGAALVQTPESAKFDGMPRAALGATPAALAMLPGEIGPHLADSATGAGPGLAVAEASGDGVDPGAHVPPERDAAADGPDTGPGIDPDADVLPRVLALLEGRLRVNFAQYKEPTIRRRLERRMRALGVDSGAAYLERLRASPDEPTRLAQSFLISVTAFFRDPPEWVALRGALARRLAETDPRRPLRAWVVGCATGEEAYSVAMLLAELVDADERPRGVQVFATDIDEPALEFARRGLYPEGRTEDVDEAGRARWFTAHGRYRRVTKSLRDSVVFARHDIVADPGFGRLDLVVCRNVLIYLRPSVQAHLARAFHRALLPGGLLMLGGSEQVHPDAGFETGIGSARIWSATATPDPPALGGRARPAPRAPLRPDRRPVIDSAREALLRRHAPMSALIDADRRCVHFFAGVERLLRLGDGTADLSLAALLPDDLAVPVLALLERDGGDGTDRDGTVAGDGAASLVVHRGPHPGDGIDGALRCTVRRVVDPDGGPASRLLEFERLDRGSGAHGADEAAAGEPAAAALERELADTRETLDAVSEAMRTGTARLSAYGERMQADGEALQASNERLQIANEELQSTNEELQTVNEELQVRSTELAVANAYMENLQAATDVALVVVDRELRVQRYTAPLARLFEILPGDIGRPLATLGSGLALDGLGRDVRVVMDELRPYSERLTHGNRQWLMRVNPYFDGNHDVSGAVLSFTDVTELSEARHDLDLRSAALEAASDGVVLVDVVDPGQPIVYASDAFCRLTGYARAEIVGRNCRFLQGPDTDDAGRAALGAAIDAREPIALDILNYRRDGAEFWNALRLSPIVDADGEVRHYVGLQTDATARKRVALEDARRANFDALTGLVNRASLVARLDALLERHGRDRAPVHVMFVDLDGFKEINDTLGHEVGDEILVQAAGRLTGCCRDGDTVARFGGDEFVIAFPGLAGLDDVMGIARALCASLHEPFALASGRHRLSASIGIAAWPADAADASTLIRHADIAMYRAKRDGRNGFAFFQPSMNAEALARSSLKQAIFDGIEANEFDLAYQPIVDVASGRIVGAEALLRWHDPQRGTREPGEFIAIAEETGQIVPLGNRVIERAVRQLHNWRTAIGADFRLAINVSARQLRSEALREALARVPDDSIRRLDIEITESVLLDRRKGVSEYLAAVRARGARISLDDFGTGYSSLRFLLDFPVDTLKIDRGFIEADLEQERNAALVDSIFALARGIGVDVVAEGVETIDQLEFVRSRGCARAQGFHFAKPLPADDFEALYRERARAPEPV